jgi:hypothetical protein
MFGNNDFPSIASQRCVADSWSSRLAREVEVEETPEDFVVRQIVRPTVRGQNRLIRTNWTNTATKSYAFTLADHFAANPSGVITEA